ncbi:putative vesicle-associated membrane-protein-associated protein [Rosa chinensis]|uniref:Putative vesicle-associated membrane-protein-associated protein n=1 Tax=Rosa chinensis TaxID=74649 RepID=A0A2P6RLZ7_ROSCH|nr:putative vesicle-associated membrane-protein-associated protein [Rosa chinensis]
MFVVYICEFVTLQRLMLKIVCCDLVTVQAQKETAPDMQCKDKFLLQSVKTNDGATPKEITLEVFNEEAGHVVEECKFRVVYVSPPQPPSPVSERSEEGSSPRASIVENENLNAAEISNVSSLIVRLYNEYFPYSEERY